MQAQDHPQYVEEEAHLARVQDYVSDEMEYWTTYNPSEFLNIKNQVTAQFEHKNQHIQELRRIQDSPYFARVDWHKEGEEAPDVFYIGRTSVQVQRIYSWKDTLPADLYYLNETDREEGEILLKRAFEIQNWNLVTISDEYVHSQFQDTLVETTFSDSLLAHLLQQSRGKKLFDIVATIQREQYEIIKAPEKYLLVVQGSAGSGKTSVALHRVAYLLYQHREDPEFSPGRLLVLGPNPMFMRYIDNVLPTLGERRVPQRTFDNWLVERLDSPSEVKYEAQETSLEILLDPTMPQSTQVMRYRNAKNKGSLAMAQMLERYVEILYRELLQDREPLRCTVTGARPIVAVRSIEEIQQVFDQFKDLPFNHRREAIENQIQEDIIQEIEGRGMTLDPDFHIHRIHSQIHAYFDDWRAKNVSVAYGRLIRTRPLLLEAGEGLFSIWDLELLAQDAPTGLTPLRFSDLAALLYLKLRLDGPGDTLYSHIVVDEAQDITPLHVKVLHEYSDYSRRSYARHLHAPWRECLGSTRKGRRRSIC
jgi:DNA helicase II / ATP-dependent DNA helicase PcrA